MDPYRAYRVELDQNGDAHGRVARLEPDTLPDHDVTVRVAYSSLNYKDALSARGHRGVTRSYPHTPGIDAAGTVIASRDPRFREGDRVIATSYDLGMNTPGGFAERIRVPGDWLVPLPEGFELRESMILGTAGLTAGLAVDVLARHGLAPSDGPALVSGASGGVGSIALALLARLGFETVAVSGSADDGDASGDADTRTWLERLGASELLPRQAFAEPSGRPLLEQRYAAAVDVAGGDTLVNIVKRLLRGGAVAACGLVQSPELPLTVYPFILRGVALLGVDSAECPMAQRRAVWERLAGDWKPQLELLATEIDLADLDRWIDAILAGETRGRVLVRVTGE